ncbi:MAG: hypothetical protein COV66_06885 [Nitrospinae bacterium CG11_big_fil_rev_8_21_14_0_20_45_15]|nr:MAG: hypothetical protein COV66_06885 [Nitrospinae bacterium CG11_big_fil_rev_8_21_14_0_20_45_15]
MIPSRTQLGLIIVGFFLVFGPAFGVHYDNAINEYHFNDDARQQIAPFVLMSQSVPPSYSSEYYVQVFSPTGFRLLYESGIKEFDPKTLSKIQPYFLAVVMYLCIGLSAWRLGGWLSCCLSLLLALSADIFMARMVGGLPRSFAFPCIAVTILCLIEARAVCLALIAVLGAAFYPTAGLISAFSLVLLLFVVPARFRGDTKKWDLKKRILCILIVAVISVAMTAPQILSGKDYGQRIGTEQLEGFPESGPGGRYGEADRPPFAGLLSTVLKCSALAFYGEPALVDSFSLHSSKYLTNVLDFIAVFSLLVIIFGVKAEWNLNSKYSRAFILLPVCIIGYLSADIFYPHLFLPERFLIYSLPVFIIVLFPACLLSLLNRLRIFEQKKQRVSVLAVLIPVLFFFVAGGVGSGNSGYSVRVDDWQPFYEKIGQLPKQSVIAGWPGGPVENIPYLSARNVLVAYETHQAFHTKYALEMRRRMDALIDAYFATDESPVIALRKQFGVDFLLLDLRHYKEKPYYFRPFDTTLDRVIQQAQGRGFYLEKNYQSLTLFQMGPLVLLDLSKVEKQSLKDVVKKQAGLAGIISR